MCAVLFAVALVLMVMGSVVLLVVNPETQGLVVGAAIVTGIATVPLVAMTLLMRRRGPAPPMPSKGKRDGWCWIIGAHPSFIVALVNGNPPGAVFGLIGGQVVPHCSVTPAQGYPPVPAPPGSWH